MMLLDTLPEFNMRRQTFGFSDHFVDAAVTGDRFSTTTEDSGTIATIDGAGGLLAMVSGATDNDEGYLKTTNEVFLFAANKPIKLAARLKFAEASGTAANVAVGLMNAVGANSIVDNGAGLVSSYSGVAFYKVDGGTNWKVEASIGTTRTGPDGATAAGTLDAAGSLDKTAHAAAGTVFQWLEIDVVPFSTTQARADFFIDGVHVQSITFTYTSATEMQAFIGQKTGSANALTVTVDYFGCQQKL